MNTSKQNAEENTHVFALKIRAKILARTYFELDIPPLTILLKSDRRMAGNKTPKEFIILFVSAFNG